MDDLTPLGAVPPGPEAFHGQVDLGNVQSSNLTLSAHGKFWLLLKTLDYCPRQCRWDSEHPTPLSWGLCLLFAFSGAFTVGKLYYNHPILDILAEDFDIGLEKASQIPTLMQAGCATGLLLCPVRDIVCLRPFVLLLVFVTVNMWLGLYITTSFSTFQALYFLVALTTVTRQVILLLVAQLAPFFRRATMISIVSGGLFMSILLARIISGVVTQYESWRIVYWISFGLQYLMLIMLFLFLPDYPPVHSSGHITYFKINYTIVMIPLRQPLLVQTSMMAFFVGAAVVSYWTVLTFLLSSSIFNLSTLAIGLFALVGMPPFLINPVLSSFITDRYHPAYSAIIAIMIGIAGVLIGNFVGTFFLAGPIIQGLLVDLCLVMSQTANRAQLPAVEPSARNRANTVYTVARFCGMLMGTAVGNHLYAQEGWCYSSGASIAFLGVALVLAVVPGPHETGWIGWRGGWSCKMECPALVEQEQV
ncbi:major facilitator superfamily domain-containing protein [Fusarium oxysporum f. sp. albedinis]|nr:major facilitator superfamily domain-containing protein [Fusarium oxysporum f. sp. albedinis]